VFLVSLLDKFWSQKVEELHTHLAMQGGQGAFSYENVEILNVIFQRGVERCLKIEHLSIKHSKLEHFQPDIPL